MLVEDREITALLVKRLSGVSTTLSAVSEVPFCVPRILGAAAALLGDREQAKAYYQQAMEVCAKIRFRPEIALTRLQLAELLLEEAEEQGEPSPQSSPKGRGRPPSPPGRGQGEGRAAALQKEAMEHLDFAVSEFQEMKMQPSLERALRHKGLLGA